MDNTDRRSNNSLEWSAANLDDRAVSSRSEPLVIAQTLVGPHFRAPQRSLLQLDPVGAGRRGVWRRDAQEDKIDIFRNTGSTHKQHNISGAQTACSYDGDSVRCICTAENTVGGVPAYTGAGTCETDDGDGGGAPRYARRRPHSYSPVLTIAYRPASRARCSEGCTAAMTPRGRPGHLDSDSGTPWAIPYVHGASWARFQRATRLLGAPRRRYVRKMSPDGFPSYSRRCKGAGGTVALPIDSGPQSVRRETSHASL